MSAETERQAVRIPDWVGITTCLVEALLITGPQVLSFGGLHVQLALRD